MNISRYSSDAKLFYVRKMNWGMTCRPNREKKYTVYASGKVVAEGEWGYDDLFKHHGSGFSTEDFAEFCNLLDGFIGVEDDKDGCDGVGYEMILYNERGNVIHKFYGYIYGNPCLEKIAKSIEKL